MPLTLPCSCCGGMGKTRRRRRWTSLPARRRTRPTGQGSKRPQSNPRPTPFLRRRARQRGAYLSRTSREKVVCPSDRVCLAAQVHLRLSSIPPRPSPGPPQPLQAYPGANASSTTTAHSYSAAAMLRLLLSEGTAIDAPRRSPLGGLLRRPATGRPAAVRVMHPSLLSPIRLLGPGWNYRHNVRSGASLKMRIFDTSIARDR
jgi:hypothetical protein